MLQLFSIFHIPMYYCYKMYFEKFKYIGIREVNLFNIYCTVYNVNYDYDGKTL